ncbi:MAG: helix-turn-helix domain-containing protein [Bacteroidota bacterium]
MQQAASMHATELSNRAIAKELGVSEGAVRKWLKKTNEPPF